jgi:hypothetical protein
LDEVAFPQQKERQFQGMIAGAKIILEIISSARMRKHPSILRRALRNASVNCSEIVSDQLREAGTHLSF